MIQLNELTKRIKVYDPSMDEDLVNRAYAYSMEMHGTQKRASGDLYFSHPLEVLIRGGQEKRLKKILQFPDLL